MKIEVNRMTRDDGALLFEIVVRDPHFAPFDEAERAMMELLESVKSRLEAIAPHDNKARIKVEEGIHWTKEKVFQKVLGSLKFSIDNELKSKFTPICQEIYNWIYDYQKGFLKQWMIEFDPQRTKYYFDNDTTIESDFVSELD